MEAMGRKVHVLTDVDVLALTGCCAFCGPDVRVLVVGHGKDGRNLYRCYVVYREERRRYKRSRHHGLNRGQAAEFLSGRGGVCEVCGSDVSMCVDHDHQSGALRGALCASCNAGVGLFKDDPARLRAAAEYLERFLQRP